MAAGVVFLLRWRLPPRHFSFRSFQDQAILATNMGGWAVHLGNVFNTAETTDTILREYGPAAALPAGQLG
jgi:hypothetical protein